MQKNLKILALVVGVGLLVFFFLKKAKAKAEATKPDIVPNAKTIADKIANAYNASVSSLSESEVQRYAGWIDAINADVVSQKAKGTNVSTARMIYNANLLKSLSDANLKAVVNYWQKARGIKIQKAIFLTGGVLDTTETIPALLRRLRDVFNF